MESSLHHSLFFAISSLASSGDVQIRKLVLKQTMYTFKYLPPIVLLYIFIYVNRFIKHAQAKHNNSLPITNNMIESKTYMNTIKKFVTDPFMFLPFLLNQSGSFFYYFIIASQPISVASPICNSLAFMFTAVTGYCYFKEELHSLTLLLIGIAFVLTGSFICITS
jgi:multidrug transporter EmrE-like cation transporter